MASDDPPADAERAYNECMLEHGMPAEWVYWDGSSTVGTDVAPGEPGYFTMETYEAASAACADLLAAGQGEPLSVQEIDERQRVFQPFLDCLSENGVPADIVAVVRKGLSSATRGEGEAIVERALGDSSGVLLEQYADVLDSCEQQVQQGRDA